MLCEVEEWQNLIL